MNLGTFFGSVLLSSRVFIYDVIADKCMSVWALFKGWSWPMENGTTEGREKAKKRGVSSSSSSRPRPERSDGLAFFFEFF
jgi:hypothetical protein